MDLKTYEEKYKWRIKEAKQIIKDTEKVIDDLGGGYNYRDDKRIITGLTDLKMKLENINHHIDSLGADLYLELKEESEKKI